MSRCFPYPPPGYCRNGATYEALIESIKLQKETTKTKADRKKEKKDRKEKRGKWQKTIENGENEVKLQKNTNGNSIKKTKTVAEQFEKSDLTEEYGQPISQHQPSYSSDSTQNSNKRKRDDYSLLHDSSISHGTGKPIKIWLLKKHKESDSSSFCADARSDAHQLKSNLISLREDRILTKSNLIFEESKISDSNGLHFGRIQSVSSFGKPIHSSGSKMSVVEVHQSARRQQLPILRFERRVLSPFCLEHEIPSSSVEQEFDSCRQQRQMVPNHHGGPNSVSNKTIASAAGKRSDHADLQKVGPTRFEKKMLKKHSKYEKLVGSLFSPVFQAHLPDGDDDWLSRSKTSSLTVSKGEVETRRQLVAPWQPCARYLAEVDMHALPYTVPF